MRDHDPSPLLHMAARMISIMIPYAEYVLIFIGDMIGGEAHRLNVSFGKEISHTFCTTCFKGSMGKDMATILDLLFLYEVGHMDFWSTWDMPLMRIWEDLFYELPIWEVIHFIWMIAWRWESLIGNEISYACHHSYLEEAIGHQEGFQWTFHFLMMRDIWFIQRRQTCKFGRNH